MSENPTRSEQMKAVLRSDSHRVLLLAQGRLAEGDWRNALALAAVSVGYSERFQGRAAEAGRIRSATGADFSLRNMRASRDHPGNTVAKVTSDITEDQARKAVELAEEAWSGIELGILSVLGTLGRGGYGVVERLRLVDGSECARKTFSCQAPDGSAHDHTIQEIGKSRFKREVRVQQALGAIVSDDGRRVALPVLHFGLEGESLWFTMPLARRHLWPAMTELRADSYSRSELLLQSEPLMLEILDCLESIHEQGYVHRDLKPENILQWNGNWVLADFGLCIAPDSLSRMTRTGVGLGTTNYLAPEQFDSARQATAKADLYSIGCILDDLYCGHYRIPHAQVTGRSGEMGKVIERCTAVNPEDRFSDVVALKAAYREAIAQDSAVG